jgi:hypothetical protein
MRNLNISNAVFNVDPHEYFLGETQLSGITSVINKHLFPDKFEGVDTEVLEAAAAKGTLIHNEIEEYLKTGEYGFTPECHAFIKWWGEQGEDFLGAEYLVNNDSFATCIDLVSAKNGEIILSNHKTTYAIDHDYSSWQGSIEAYLFERQNPDLKVSTLRIIWLRDSKIEIVEVPRKTDAEVEALLQAELAGEIYQPKELVSANVLTKVFELESLLKEIDAQKKQAEEQAKILRDELMMAMENQGVKSFENEQLKITYILPTTRETIDSKKLKSEYPEIAEKVTRETKTKASIRITLR